MQGQTGTGKELVAREVHDGWASGGPLVAVNCAAISTDLAESAFFGHKRGAFSGAINDAAGFFAAASGGTLFLDEIGELPHSMQSKLLRALDLGEVVPVGASVPHKVDVRIVAATNVPLLAAVRRGLFREDLYARLAVMKIEAPPLRARRADVLLLLRHFLGEGEWRFDATFVLTLLGHDWPRNVRELKAFAERLRALGTRELSSTDAERAFDRMSLPNDAPAPPTEDEMRALLVRFSGNVARVARQLACHRRQLYRWRETYGLDPHAFRRPRGGK